MQNFKWAISNTLDYIRGLPSSGAPSVKHNHPYGVKLSKSFKFLISETFEAFHNN